jgi:hypothetical protein
MLPKSYLKLMAAHVVHKSKLEYYSKIQALRFIEEASERQLLVFMSEGVIRGEEEISEIAPVVLIAPLVAAAVAVSSVAYGRYLGPAAKACASRKGKDRTVCIKNYRVRANMARLAALKREMSKCNQTNNMKKCRAMFMKHMKRIEGKIKKDRVY